MQQGISNDCLPYQLLEQRPSYSDQTRDFRDLTGAGARLLRVFLLVCPFARTKNLLTRSGCQRYLLLHRRKKFIVELLVFNSSLAFFDSGRLFAASAG